MMADGAVIFITDSVEAGDSRHTQVWLNGDRAVNNNLNPLPGAAPGSESPYGLWGALGTRDSAEVVEVDF